MVARATEPALAAIKLAWWRERLEDLDRGLVPAEPRLQAAAVELLPRGIAGSELAELEDGWASLLDERPDFERIASSGARLFEIAGKILGVQDAVVIPAGRLYAVQGAARRGLARTPGQTGALKLPPGPVPKALRPLTAFAALALRDARSAPPFEPEGSPGRAMTLLKHRLTGRLA